MCILYEDIWRWSAKRNRKTEYVDGERLVFIYIYNSYNSQFQACLKGIWNHLHIQFRPKRKKKNKMVRFSSEKTMLLTCPMSICFLLFINSMKNHYLLYLCIWIEMPKGKCLPSGKRNITTSSNVNILRLR